MFFSQTDVRVASPAGSERQLRLDAGGINRRAVSWTFSPGETGLACRRHLFLTRNTRNCATHINVLVCEPSGQDGSGLTGNGSQTYWLRWETHRSNLVIQVLHINVSTGYIRNRDLGGVARRRRSDRMNKNAVTSALWSPKDSNTLHVNKPLIDAFECTLFF